MKRLLSIISFFVLTLFITACMQSNAELDESLQEPLETEEVYHDTEATIVPFDIMISSGDHDHEVVLMNSEGERTGIATLEQAEEGVLIHLEAWGLPEGIHGFHIHEKGLCKKPDFESAGEHFNPTNAKHGFENPQGPHAGDLPNIEVGEDGTVKKTVIVDMVTLEKGEKNSLLHEGGTALIIHADPDDYISQPAGNSGARIACGVIGQ